MREFGLLLELLNVAVDIYVVMLLLRLFIAERDFYFNPMLGVIRKATDPVIAPFRSLGLTFRERDFAPLVAALLVIIVRGVLLGLILGAVSGGGRSSGLGVAGSLLLSPMATGFAVSFLRLIDLIFQVLLVSWLIWAMVPRLYNAFARIISAISTPLASLNRVLPVRSPWVPVAIGLVGLIAVRVLVMAVVVVAFSGGAVGIAGALQLGLENTLRLFFQGLYFFILVLIVGALMSWFSPDPNNPLVQMVDAVSDALMRPFRWMPLQLGGIDFTPLVAIIAYSLLLSWIQRLVFLLF